MYMYISRIMRGAGALPPKTACVPRRYPGDDTDECWQVFREWRVTTENGILQTPILPAQNVQLPQTIHINLFPFRLWESDFSQFAYGKVIFPISPMGK